MPARQRLPACSLGLRVPLETLYVVRSIADKGVKAQARRDPHARTGPFKAVADPGH